MTDKRRLEIAKEYRREIDKRAGKEQRKNWVPQWLEDRGISRRSLYDYLKRFGISTR